jgi:hypothetical protein
MSLKREIIKDLGLEAFVEKELFGGSNLLRFQPIDELLKKINIDRPDSQTGPGNWIQMISKAKPIRAFFITASTAKRKLFMAIVPSFLMFLTKKEALF